MAAILARGRGLGCGNLGSLAFEPHLDEPA